MSHFSTPSRQHCFAWSLFFPPGSRQKSPDDPARRKYAATCHATPSIASFHGGKSGATTRTHRPGKKRKTRYLQLCHRAPLFNPLKSSLTGLTAPRGFSAGGWAGGVTRPPLFLNYLLAVAPRIRTIEWLVTGCDVAVGQDGRPR